MPAKRTPVNNTSTAKGNSVKPKIETPPDSVAMNYPYPCCYELINTTLTVPVRGGQVILRAGINNVHDAQVREELYKHPTIQMLMDVGMVYCYNTFSNNNSVNSLGLEVEDGILGDELPVADLDKEHTNLNAEYRLGSAEEVGKAKEKVMKSAKENKEAKVIKSEDE
jgi:hypothetical protein